MPRHHHHTRHHHHGGPRWDLGWGGGGGRRSDTVIIGGGGGGYVGLIVLLIFIFVFLPFIIWGIVVAVKSSNRDNFSESKTKKVAKKLKEKGWVFFGMESCGWCKKQKLQFEKDFDMIEYVDCQDSGSKEKCKGLTGFPSWKNKNTGKMMMGYQSLDKLDGVE